LLGLWFGVAFRWGILQQVTLLQQVVSELLPEKQGRLLLLVLHLLAPIQHQAQSLEQYAEVCLLYLLYRYYES
jgi:hypothetical protein